MSELENVKPEIVTKVKKPRSEKQIAATKLLVERNRLKREAIAKEKLNPKQPEPEPVKEPIKVPEPVKESKEVVKIKVKKERVKKPIKPPTPPPANDISSDSSDDSPSEEHYQPTQPIYKSPIYIPKRLPRRHRMPL